MSADTAKFFSTMPELLPSLKVRAPSARVALISAEPMVLRVLPVLSSL